MMKEREEKEKKKEEHQEVAEDCDDEEEEEERQSCVSEVQSPQSCQQLHEVAYCVRSCITSSEDWDRVWQGWEYLEEESTGGELEENV